MGTTLVALITLAAAPLHTGELIFPPNSKHNHGSSIVETPGGGLLAVWFHGSGERTADDVLLQGARKTKGSDTWSAPFLMADTPNLPDCNPVLFVDPDDTLWLFWLTVQSNQWESSLLKYRTSTDYEGGRPPQWDWQDVIHVRPRNFEAQFTAMLDKAQSALAPFLDQGGALQELADRGYEAAQDKLQRRLGWMTRVHPIITRDGRLMLGLYSDLFNCSLAAFTDDSGATWSFSEPILYDRVTYLGNIQPSFVQKKNGDIVAFMRDNGIPKHVRKAVSNDGGRTWPETGLAPIRDPGASVECVALESGRWVLVNNNQVNGRHRLTAHLSEDEGETWEWSRPLEEVPPGKGSFSYPSVIQAADGSIHVTYSYNKAGIDGSSIKHARFNEAWILE